MLRRAFLVLALSLLAVAAPRAQTAEGAGQFIQKLGQDVIAVLETQGLDQPARERQFHAILNQVVDAESVSRTVLGRYWNSASEAERAEFRKLYQEYLVRIYSSRFARFNGEKFVVKGQRPEGDRDFLVFSNIEPQDGPAYVVNWRVRQVDGGFRVVDVMAEGVSLLITHNQEFASVIRNNGGRVSALLNALRNRVGQG